MSEGLTVRKELRDGEVPLYLSGRSNELRRFYSTKAIDPDSDVPRPRRILTEWWASVIQRVRRLPQELSWEIACVLLDLSFEKQQGFEQRFDKTISKVRKKGNDCGENGLFCFLDKNESNAVVVGFAYRNLTREERNLRAEDLSVKAHELSGTPRAIVIGMDVDRCGYPYDFLGLFDSAAPSVSDVP